MGESSVLVEQHVSPVLARGEPVPTVGDGLVDTWTTAEAVVVVLDLGKVGASIGEPLSWTSPPAGEGAVVRRGRAVCLRHASGAPALLLYLVGDERRRAPLGDEHARGVGGSSACTTGGGRFDVWLWATIAGLAVAPSTSESAPGGVTQLTTAFYERWRDAISADRFDEAEWLAEASRSLERGLRVHGASVIG